jgi:hypothetical protein
MKQSALISMGVAALAATAALFAGFNFLAPAAAQPEFARPIELQFWPSLAGRLDPEPIVDPRQIAQVISACVASSGTIEACAARRAVLVERFAAAIRDSDALRATASCLAEGCDGLTPVAPANACLFWTLYLDRHPGRAEAADRASKKQSCTWARFGDEARRDAIVRLWNRSANSQ